jgi:hypothetical protein
MDFSGNSFISDLVSGSIDAVFDATDGQSAGSKTLVQLLEALQIPLLLDGYCYHYMGCLLNMKGVEHGRFRRTQYFGH